VSGTHLNDLVSSRKSEDRHQMSVVAANRHQKSIIVREFDGTDSSIERTGSDGGDGRGTGPVTDIGVPEKNDRFLAHTTSGGPAAIAGKSQTRNVVGVAGKKNLKKKTKTKERKKNKKNKRKKERNREEQQEQKRITMNNKK
jgi:hypothetical protein